MARVGFNAGRSAHARDYPDDPTAMRMVELAALDCVVDGPHVYRSTRHPTRNGHADRIRERAARTCEISAAQRRLASPAPSTLPPATSTRLARAAFITDQFGDRRTVLARLVSVDDLQRRQPPLLGLEVTAPAAQPAIRILGRPRVARADPETGPTPLLGRVGRQ